MGYCQVCKCKWNGLNACHCTGCHKTFKSLSGFDKHRRDFKCLDPLEIGMEMDSRGIWRTPIGPGGLTWLKSQT